MTDKKISQLTESTTPAADDVLVIVDDSESETKKIKYGNLRRFVDNETPSGTVDGLNKEFTLAETPNPAASLKLYLNGMYQAPGGEDYTLSGNTITFVNAPWSGSILRVFYRY